MGRLRILFVCSRNRWRSPSAERLYARDPRVEVRSAGTSSSARRRVREADLEWADLVLVMQHEHKRRLRRLGSSGGHIEVLDIPDDYAAMDPELVELLTERVEPWIDAYR